MIASRPLRTVARALRHHHHPIWGLPLAAMAVALLASLVLPPSYAATAELNLDEQSATGAGFDLALQADQYLTQRIVALAGSPDVLAGACRTIGSGCDTSELARQVRAAPTRATGVIAITARAPSAAEAARWANAVADQVVARNAALDEAALAPARDYLQGELTQLDAQRTAIQQRITSYPRSGLSDAAFATATAPILAQLDQVQAQQSVTYGRLQDLQMEQARVAGALTVRQSATAPAGPDTPAPLRYALVGLAAGLVIGCLLALLLDQLDGRLRDASDLAVAAGVTCVVDGGGLAASDCALLAQAGVLASGGDAPGVLLVAAARGERVALAGEQIARAAAELGERVALEIPAAAERAQRERVGSGLIIRARAGQARAVARPGDDLGLVLTCTAAPAVDARVLVRGRDAACALIVATAGVTCFADAARTASLLRMAGIEVAGGVLLPREPSPPARRVRLRRPGRAAAAVSR